MDFSKFYNVTLTVSKGDDGHVETTLRGKVKKGLDPASVWGEARPALLADQAVAGLVFVADMEDVTFRVQRGQGSIQSTLKFVPPKATG